MHFRVNNRPSLFGGQDTYRLVKYHSDKSQYTRHITTSSYFFCISLQVTLDSIVCRPLYLLVDNCLVDRQRRCSFFASWLRLTHDATKPKGMGAMFARHITSGFVPGGGQFTPVEVAYLAAQAQSPERCVLSMLTFRIKST